MDKTTKAIIEAGVAVVVAIASALLKPSCTCEKPPRKKR